MKEFSLSSQQMRILAFQTATSARRAVSEENQDFCSAVQQRKPGFLQGCARRNHEICQDFSENKFQTSAELATWLTAKQKATFTSFAPSLRILLERF